MRVKCGFEGTTARLELEPENSLERAFVDGLGNVQQAQVKRNGVLTFTLDVPVVSVKPPVIERSADEVRDVKGGE